ncbi:hypothetical protein PanWU01x14_094730, partial [Parasponia andersonii]
MQLVNEVFLAKWGWKCLNQEKSLWLELVQSKYLRGNEFQFMEAGRGDSWIWKVILKIREILKMGACRRLRHGSVIDVWNDHPGPP